MRPRIAAIPLFWQVFGINAVVLLLAFAALSLAPVRVSVPVRLTEFMAFFVGLALMLILSVVLLRIALRPLHAVTVAMRGLDLLEPGKQLPVVKERDVATLAHTFNEMLDRLEGERRESARQALRVQEGERQRVSRELHDEVGQTLTAMMLQIESLAGKIPGELRDELEDLRETTRLGAEDVRRIAARLRPEAPEDLGLQSALSALASSFAEHVGIRIERRLEPAPPLTDEQKLVVYRVAQEALTNITRHARATNAELRLERIDGEVILHIRDDGRGSQRDAFSSSTGIRGMRERAMLIGARLSIAPADGGGTEVVLLVPCGD